MAIGNSTNTDETGVQTFSATTGDWVGSPTTQYIVQLGDTSNKLTGVSGTGTAAQVLTSNGSGAAPTWQDAAASTDLHVARFIVSAGGTPDGANYTTIASALTAASSGDTIFIQTGTYTENLTLKAGVNLTAFTCDAYTPNVTIKGKMTFTATGTSSISGIQLETNSDNFLSITGSNALEINFINCFLDVRNNTGISINNANALVNFYHCKGDIATTGITYFTSTACDTLSFEYCYFNNTGDSSTASTIAAGDLRRWWCRFETPISATGSGGVTDRWSRTELSDLDVTALTLNTSNDSDSFHCVYSSGTATAIVVTSGQIKILNGHISSSNTNAISGAGTVKIAGNTFLTSSQISSSTSTTFYPEGPRIALGGTGNAQVMCGTGSPSGSVTAPKGTLYLRTDGSSSSTRAYINSNGGTSWVSVTTAS